MAATGFAQNLTEFGAAAAGSTIGAVGGKPVSNGISAVFGKVDRQTASAAGNETKKVAPATPAIETGGVPPPPSDPRRRALLPPSLPMAQITIPEEARQFLTLADVAPALPPPPVMSPEDFRTIANGMTRADVLKFGAPADKIMMWEDGHLLEVYSYRQNGQRVGTLRLIDGSVSSIQ